MEGLCNLCLFREYNFLSNGLNSQANPCLSYIYHRRKLSKIHFREFVQRLVDDSFFSSFIFCNAKEMKSSAAFFSFLFCFSLSFMFVYRFRQHVNFVIPVFPVSHFLSFKWTQRDSNPRPLACYYFSWVVVAGFEPTASIVSRWHSNL